MNNFDENNFGDKLNTNPIKRFVEKDTFGEGLSPMDPPNAYNPQNIEAVPYEKLPPFLQLLIDEHKDFSVILNNFEKALLQWRENNWVFNDEINHSFKLFFTFMDEKLPSHNQKEEKILFPLLHKRLIESGEHNSNDSSVTAINLMEDEHIKVAQSAAIVFNFLGLGSRLPDQESRNITFSSAYEQGIVIVETMKLHIFREESILFTQAMNLLTKDEISMLENDASH